MARSGAVGAGMARATRAESPGAGQQAPRTAGVASQGATGRVGASQTLVLDGYPSQEQQDLLGPNRGSRRWGVATERANVQQATAAAARAQGIAKVPPPVRVTYCFVVPDHGRRDWDNYALICKPVQDGLVKAEILVGDHYAVLDAAVRFRVEKGRRALEVTIEPAPSGRG